MTCLMVVREMKCNYQWCWKCLMKWDPVRTDRINAPALCGCNMHQDDDYGKSDEPRILSSEQWLELDIMYERLRALTHWPLWMVSSDERTAKEIVGQDIISTMVAHYLVPERRMREYRTQLERFEKACARRYQAKFKDECDYLKSKFGAHDAFKSLYQRCHNAQARMPGAERFATATCDEMKVLMRDLFNPLRPDAIDPFHARMQLGSTELDEIWRMRKIIQGWERGQYNRSHISEGFSSGMKVKVNSDIANGAYNGPLRSGFHDFGDDCEVTGFLLGKLGMNKWTMLVDSGHIIQLPKEECTAVVEY